MAELMMWQRMGPPKGSLKTRRQLRMEMAELVKPLAAKEQVSKMIGQRKVPGSGQRIGQPPRKVCYQRLALGLRSGEAKRRRQMGR
jgi:hypothetical protein